MMSLWLKFIQWLHQITAPKPQPIPVLSPAPTVPPISTDLEPGSIAWYAHLFGEANVTTQDSKYSQVLVACEKIEANKQRYQAVEKTTRIPWYFIAALHYRESSLDFTRYLGNGDPLNQKTVHFPAGRGPFASWELGAYDALRVHFGIDAMGNIKAPATNVPSLLQAAESYNGLGYLKYHYPHVLSPYLWSFTDLYTSGKYSSDGHFDPNLADQQVGVAAIFKDLKLRGSI